MNKIKKVFDNPEKIIYKLQKFKLFNFLKDETYIKMIYAIAFREKLNIEQPTTFTEKLQWLKLNDRNPQYTKMVDKCEAKEFVGKIIGSQYIVPTIGVWDNFNQINFDLFPNSFVLKTTHDSGSVVICKDKKDFDLKKAKKIITKSLKNNYFYMCREWPYKNVKPRIIAEEYLGDLDTMDIKDYKFFCFDGKPEVLLVCSERMTSDNMCKTWFDSDFNMLDIVENNHRRDMNLTKPENYEKMKEIASKLSKNIPFVRIDLYEVDNRVYFGEITFFPSGGIERFSPEEWNYELGKKIDLKKEINYGK